MPHLIKLELDAEKAKERILIKDVTTADELEQLYFSLRALLEEHGSTQVEVWVPAE